ncbi:MAG: hypothetical protein AAFR61_10120 [Bacteroidota bacterium]
MKHRIWFLLVACIAFFQPGQAQVLEVELGMSEQQLLQHVNPRYAVEPFKQISHSGNSYVFEQEALEGYRTRATFGLRDGVVNSIRIEQFSKNETYRKALVGLYDQTIQDWQAKTAFQPYPIASKATLRQYRDYRAQAEAYTDGEMTRMHIFVIYHKNGQAIFSRVSRLF